MGCFKVPLGNAEEPNLRIPDLDICSLLVSSNWFSFSKKIQSFYLMMVYETIEMKIFNQNDKQNTVLPSGIAVKKERFRPNNQINCYNKNNKTSSSYL